MLWTQKRIKKKARPIIAKFVRYYHRKEVLSKKKYLKEKGIPITENLTSFKMKKLERSIAFFFYTTIDGRILFRNGNNKPSLYYG